MESLGSHLLEGKNLVERPNRELKLPGFLFSKVKGKYTPKREENGGCQVLGIGGKGESLVKGHRLQAVKMNKFWISNVQHDNYNSTILYT